MPKDTQELKVKDMFPCLALRWRKWPYRVERDGETIFYVFPMEAKDDLIKYNTFSGRDDDPFKDFRGFVEAYNEWKQNLRLA